MWATPTKRDVFILLALDVETEGVIEIGCVSIGRRIPERDAFALWDFDTANLGVLTDDSLEVGDG